MGTTDGGKTPGKQPSQQSPKGLIYYFLTIFLVMILSILVDTFISKISLPMQPVPEIGSISVA